MTVKFKPVPAFATTRPPVKITSEVIRRRIAARAYTDRERFKKDLRAYMQTKIGRINNWSEVWRLLLDKGQYSLPLTLREAQHFCQLWQIVDRGKR